MALTNEQLILLDSLRQYRTSHRKSGRKMV